MTMRPPPAFVVEPPGLALDVPARQAARWGRLTAAFAEAASVIAREADLTTVLDRLASEVRAVTGLLTCAILLVDEVTEALHHVGRSGLPEDYPERVEEARRNGAPMATLEAYRQRRAVVAPGSHARVLGDPRWAPTHDIVRDNDWDTFVAVPLIVRGESIGVLNGFSPGGSEPWAVDVPFLQVMADHAAIAVDNARMSAELQLRAAEEERQRLARDLHDSVNQALFSLTVSSRGLELRVRDSDAACPDRDALAGELGELRALAQEALGDMRSLIAHRRPLELRDHGLVRAVETLAESTSRRTGLVVEVHADREGALPVGRAAEEDLFRLVQEALNNVVKHARARTVAVEILTDGADGLAIEVTDDGVGLRESSGAGAHFGMRTMRERATRHGARLTVGPGPGAVGTRVRVCVPGVPA
jgi:signal transduction histidine kinase